MDFLYQDAPTVARALIGWRLFVREENGKLTGGSISETEAYMAHDAASHSFRGKTARNEVMFGPAGYAYVYFTYGLHWCFNIVTGQEGDGQAVLIRALIPTHNVELMQTRRNRPNRNDLANGPAKLCQALGITNAENGLALNQGRIVLLAPNTTRRILVRETERIGIKQNTNILWRFTMSGVE